MTGDSERAPGEPAWVKLGAAAGLGQLYEKEGREFLEPLAIMLQGALPGEVTIARGGGLFARKKSVRQIRLELGNVRFILEDPGKGGLHATQTQVVRGIALKTEEITISDWLQQLGEFLDDRARTSAQTREALARMVW